MSKRRRGKKEAFGFKTLELEVKGRYSRVHSQRQTESGGGALAEASRRR